METGRNIRRSDTEDTKKGVRASTSPYNQQYEPPGSIFSAQERWKKAKTMFSQIMDARTRALGSEHPTTLISAANLATVYRKQELYRKAQKLQSQVLKANVKVLGPEHPQSVEAMASLALTLMHREQWKMAEELQVRASRLKGKVLGERYLEMILCIENLGDLNTATGRLDEAKRLYDKASSLREQGVEVKASDPLVSPRFVWIMGIFKTLAFR